MKTKGQRPFVPRRASGELKSSLAAIMAMDELVKRFVGPEDEPVTELELAKD